MVLLHAYPLSSQMWDELGAFPGWEFIFPDFPGFGASSIPDKEITLREAAQTLVKEIEKQVGSESFVLGGISMGGYWALEILRQFPKKIDGLILISTRAGLDTFEAKKKRLDIANRAENEGISWLPDQILSGLLGASTQVSRPEVVAKVRKLLQEAGCAGVSLAQRAMANRRDQTDLCPGIQQKTLIMAGQEDGLIPVTEAALLAEAIPGSKKVIFEKVGHLPPLEEPLGFALELEKFLSELQRT